MISAAQQKPLDLPSGLFLIKYEAADDSRHPPKVTFSVAPLSARTVEFVLPPEISAPVLWSPGGSMVVRATSPSQLLVEVAASVPGGSLAARIQSTTLSTDPLGLALVNGGMVSVDTSAVRLLGHLAGRGDVYAAPGEWLGGPMAPSRIEGIAIEWADKPPYFDLHYSVRIGGSAPANSQNTEAGNFAGSRGRALPLVGATLEISGSGSTGYQVVADALFLGSPQMRISGQRVVLAGPTGREPLVGLRLQISRVEEDPKPLSPKAPLAPRSAIAAKSGGGRVRVFRSKATKA